MESADGGHETSRLRICLCHVRNAWLDYLPISQQVCREAGIGQRLRQAGEREIMTWEMWGSHREYLNGRHQRRVVPVTPRNGNPAEEVGW